MSDESKQTDQNGHTGQNERRVLRVWVRDTKGAVPEERQSLQLIAGEGVVGDHKLGGKRHVTFVFQDEWREAEAALGRTVDPVGRRANVYVSGGNCGALIGRTVHVGETVIEIRGETKPCPVMEEAAEGLEAALGPNFRAGVWGVVTTGGALRPGDALR